MSGHRKKTRVPSLFLAICLVLGCSLRFAGLTRGDSSFVLPGPNQSTGDRAFYHFHPDETTLVQAALGPIDPFAPELTSYGTLPVYLLRGFLELNRIVLGRDFKSQESPDDVRYVYLTARTLAVLVSCLTLYLVWLAGVRWFGELTGLLAVFIVAVAPLAIQLAHFYTVDGLFALLVLAAVHALLNALEKDDRRWFIWSGFLIGLSGAVRLIGLSVGLVLLAGHLVRQRHLKAVLAPRIWMAGLAAVLALLALQPFLVTDWDLIFRAHSSDDLGYSMIVARGERLVPWSLVDVHTVPYLHYWTHLWPLGVGWPLTLLFLLGISRGLWKRNHRNGLILLWAGIYFFLIGGLHTKHIRYLLPLLPFLALLAADFCVWFVRSPRFVRVRMLAVGICAAVFAYSALYGVAFASLYTREDSRVQTARWINDHVPANSSIGVERGAFSMRGMIDPAKFQIGAFQTLMLFQFRGFATCKGELYWLKRQLDALDYIVITDVNRYQHFTAVPELIPGGAALYEALVEGDLGFDLVRRFKNYPSIGGLEFRDDGSEPSFTGFDHPAVMVFRKDETEWQAAWTHFQERMPTSPYCADPLLETAASALREGDLNASLRAISEAKRQLPQSKVAHLVEAEVLKRMGQSDKEAMELYLTGTVDRFQYLYFWASGMSLVELGLPGLSFSVLEEGARQASQPTSDTSWLANQYSILSLNLYDRGAKVTAAELLSLSIRIHPLPKAYNFLSHIALRENSHENAAKFLELSLKLDDKQARVHGGLGQILAPIPDHRDQALFHLQRAVELDPGLGTELAPWIEASEETKAD